MTVMPLEWHYWLHSSFLYEVGVTIWLVTVFHSRSAQQHCVSKHKRRCYYRVQRTYAISCKSQWKRNVSGKIVSVCVCVCVCIYIYIYISEPICCIAEINTTLQVKHTSLKFLFNLFIWLCWFLVAACELFVVACGIQFSDQGSNPGTLHWECRVLATQPPGKSLQFSFKKIFLSKIKSPFQRRPCQPTPVLLPGKSHGQRSLVGCRPWRLKESDMTSISLSLFTFMQWRRKWQPTPVFLPGESHGQRSLVGCRLQGRTESDTTIAIQQQQQQQQRVL